jgi:hypothetical protein
MKVSALVAAILTLSSFSAVAQTNASNASTVGTWKLDVAKSDFGSDSAPKAATLTILKDTPQQLRWRHEWVDDKGESITVSWIGPQDGSLQPLKGAKGEVIAQESFKRDKDGAVLRHLDGNDGASFDGHSVFSADGNTMTDVVTSKAKDGKTSKITMIYRRVAGAK